MSQYYFSKLFKMSTGTTPHQYVMRQRVERAQEHLRESRTALAEVATQVGFETQSHFTSVFRRLVGATPKHYREITSPTRIFTASLSSRSRRPPLNRDPIGDRLRNQTGASHAAPVCGPVESYCCRGAGRFIFVLGWGCSQAVLRAGDFLQQRIGVIDLL